MTKSNSKDWWSVAKVYLNERWEKARSEFDPLIRHLKLRDAPLYESEIKSRVIDNNLKDAFMGLAQPDL
jgi:hypothetical protein